MTLLLTSNGLKGQLAEEFKSLLKKPAAENKLLFITTAGYGDDDDVSWLEKYRNELGEQGIQDIEDLDLRNIRQEELEQKLNEKDIIYINGGNTFFLLYYVRQSGFDKAIQKFLGDGKLYIGVSAGSIIPNPKIDIAGLHLSDEYPADANNVGLTDLTGLNLVNFFISPHFEDTQKDLMENEAKKLHLPLYALTDLQAIVVENGNTKLVGEGEKVIFNQSPEHSIELI